MNNINPIYSIYNTYSPYFKQKETSENAATNSIESNDSANEINTPNGMNLLANYNKININTNENKLDTKISSKINYLLTNDDYMNDVHLIQKKRDFNNDGEVSVEETLATDYLKFKYSDLGEQDKEALTKYAMLDGNMNVSDEEYVKWLEGKEHQDILDEFKIRDAEEIKSKRNHEES